MTVRSIDVKRALNRIPLNDIVQITVITKDTKGIIHSYTTYPNTPEGELQAADDLWTAYETYEPGDE